MGVKGLWTILEPAGEPVAQSSLRGHRLAVDASIWMYQLTKALPDASTGTAGYNPLVLAGLFKRILKLMHFGIRPVFVFDGATPELKAATVRERRGRRAEAESRYKSLAKKMLKIRLRMHALGRTDGKDEAVKPVAEEKDSSEAEEESSEEELFDIDYEQLDRLDIASPDFQSLPLDLKQELLAAMKERALAEKSNRSAGFSSDALAFSHGQIEALVKRRRIAAELERVSRSSFGAFGAAPTGDGQSYRIASSSTREFVLVKNEGGAGWSFDRQKAVEDSVVVPSESPSPSKKTVEADHEDDEAFERMFFGEEPIRPEPAAVQIAKSSVNAVKPVEVPEEKEGEMLPSESEPESEIASEDELLEASEIISNAALKAIPPAPVATRIAVETEEIPDHEGVQEAPPVIIPAPPIDHVEEEEEDLDGFLEAFRNTTKEDIEERLRQSLLEAQSDLAAAQGEARGLESELLADFKHLLGLFGLPFMDAEAEAEAQCAWLHARGLVDGVVTDDSDIWLFAPAASLIVYRNFFKEGKAVMAFGGPRIGMQLDLRREDLVCLAMWLGGDYGTGVRGLGTTRALGLLRILKRSQTHHRIKDVTGMGYCVALLSLFKAAHEDLDAVRAEWTLEDQTALDRLLRHVHHLDAAFPTTRIIEAYLEPAVSQDARPFRWQLPNPVGLEAFFAARLGWPAERTRSQLLPVLRSTKDNSVQ